MDHIFNNLRVVGEYFYPIYWVFLTSGKPEYLYSTFSAVVRFIFIIGIVLAFIWRSAYYWGFFISFLLSQTLFLAADTFFREKVLHPGFIVLGFAVVQIWLVATISIRTVHRDIRILKTRVHILPTILLACFCLDYGFYIGLASMLIFWAR